MLKKIVIVSEKVLLVLILLSYLIYFILNIGTNRLSLEFAENVQSVFMVLIGFYAILSPLRRLSNVILFLISATVAGVVICLSTRLIFLNFISMNLFIIFVIYLVVSVKSFFVIKGNGFLKWLISVTSIIIFLYIFLIVVSILFAVGSAEKGFNEFDVFVYVLFIIATLAIIFGLPNSKYPEWKKEHRQLFLKLILSMWIFIFIISTLRLFIPFERYKEKIFPELNEKWGMRNYVIDQKPGLKD